VDDAPEMLYLTNSLICLFTEIRHVLCGGYSGCHEQPIGISKHVAGVGAENDVDTRAVVDDERKKRPVTGVDSDVLICRRNVK